jgi:hypothetical protein
LACGSTGSFRQTESRRVHQNTKVSTDVGVAERGCRVPLLQVQKVRREHPWIDHGYLVEDCKRHAQGYLLVADTFQQFGGPGAIRTRDTRFRRAVLYPLSYGAIWSRVPVGS